MNHRRARRRPQLITSAVCLLLGLATLSAVPFTCARVVAAGPSIAGNRPPLGIPLSSQFDPRAPVLVGAGDICWVRALANAQQTATLVKDLPGARVFTLGDNAQIAGTAREYSECYGKSWGAFKSRTRPVAGNHDMMTAHGAPYYDYFGAAAGSPGQGWYSYNLPNNWHVVVLNSECAAVGGCGKGSPQERWLRGDLGLHAGSHIIAMWHIPEFSSGAATPDATVYRAFWNDLYAAHAEIVLNGHHHVYERFAQQSPSGRADPMGMREFIVGTGGMELHRWGTIAKNSEVRIAGTYGVLELVLNRDSYDWRFIRVGDEAAIDWGRTATHPTLADAGPRVAGQPIGLMSWK